MSSPHISLRSTFSKCPSGASGEPWTEKFSTRSRTIAGTPAACCELVNTFFFRASGGVPPREPYATPEREKEYPEPSMFGMMPAYGFFLRHVKGIELNNVEVSFQQEDRRPAFVLDTVKSAGFQHVKAPLTRLLVIVTFSVDLAAPMACVPSRTMASSWGALTLELEMRTVIDAGSQDAEVPAREDRKIAERHLSANLEGDRLVGASAALPAHQSLAADLLAAASWNWHTNPGVKRERASNSPSAN